RTQSFDGILHGGRSPEVRREASKVVPAELRDELVLVGEVLVDRGRRVFDPLGDLAHRDRVVPLAHEELARGVEDLRSKLLLLALASLLGAHNEVPLVNNVNLEILVAAVNTVLFAQPNYLILRANVSGKAPACGSEAASGRRRSRLPRRPARARCRRR